MDVWEYKINQLILYFKLLNIFINRLYIIGIWRILNSLYICVSTLNLSQVCDTTSKL